MILLPTMNLYHFKTESDLSQWLIVDDVVMGGDSSGNIFLNESGNAVFEGTISLDHNGGFSMVEHFFPKTHVKPYSKTIIRLKGDGKTYQFRVKSSNRDYFSYVYSFKTSGSWESIEIPFQDMYPAFRGRKLRKPNFAGFNMEMIAFFIGNKKEESFRLEIEKIYLE